MALAASGAAAVAFFGAVLVLAVPSLVRPGGLALTPHRIAYRSGFGRFSGRWDDIEELRTAMHGGQPSLGLRATEAGLLDLCGLPRDLVAAWDEADRSPREARLRRRAAERAAIFVEAARRALVDEEP